ncbi:MAG: c-type cytochrome biogenesis protein CcmI [Rubrivivax sp.]|nr:MAG: c-type cytochrome biogenesis protein CcmI [Rubrivivax sp.]
MTTFWLATLAMLGLSLLFVWPPLLKRDPASVGVASVPATAAADALNLDVLRDQLRELTADLHAGTIDADAYQSARLDLERRVAQEVQQAGRLPAKANQRQPWTALAVALAVAGIGLSLYAKLGTPKALEAASLVQTPAEPSVADGPPAVTEAQIEGMVARLAEKLKAKPDDAQGWRMLARSYETLRRFDQAVEAYQHLLTLQPNDANVLVDYAVTLAMSSGQSLTGEPERVIQRALALDPDNVQALALAGSAAFERRDYAQAIKPWQQVLARVPPESSMAESIKASIAKAQALAARKPGRAGQG